jgi:hypothetical protein
MWWISLEPTLSNTYGSVWIPKEMSSICHGACPFRHLQDYCWPKATQSDKFELLIDLLQAELEGLTTEADVVWPVSDSFKHARQLWIKQDSSPDGWTTRRKRPELLSCQSSNESKKWRRTSSCWLVNIYGSVWVSKSKHNRDFMGPARFVISRITVRQKKTLNRRSLWAQDQLSFLDMLSPGSDLSMAWLRTSCCRGWQICDLKLLPGGSVAVWLLMDANLRLMWFVPFTWCVMESLDLPGFLWKETMTWRPDDHFKT